jgi:hypothetical protein
VRHRRSLALLNAALAVIDEAAWDGFEMDEDCVRARWFA